jgi:hypothetical protein
MHSVLKYSAFVSKSLSMISAPSSLMPLIKRPRMVPCFTSSSSFAIASRNKGRITSSILATALQALLYAVPGTPSRSPKFCTIANMVPCLSPSARAWRTSASCNKKNEDTGCGHVAECRLWRGAARALTKHRRRERRKRLPKPRNQLNSKKQGPLHILYKSLSRNPLNKTENCSTTVQHATG